MKMHHGVGLDSLRSEGRRLGGVVAVLSCGAALLVGCTSSGEPPAPLPPGVIDVIECQPLAILNCQDQVATIRVDLYGTGPSIVYRSDRVPGRTTAQAADVRGQGLGGFTLDVHHSYDPSTNVLLQGDGVLRLVPAVTAGDELLIASTDARHVFVFDEDGRHRRTVDAITGATLWTFEEDESGRLSALRDQAGQELRFEHDSSGHLSAITLPGGATLRAETDQDGYLTSLQRPDLTQQTFTYGTGGLLSSQTATDLGGTSYEYDSDGRLTAFIERSGTTSFERGQAKAATRST